MTRPHRPATPPSSTSSSRRPPPTGSLDAPPDGKEGLGLGVWAHLGDAVEPYTLRRAQLTPLMSGLAAKGYAVAARVLREDGDLFFRLAGEGQGRPDGLLGKNDLFADGLLAALLHADTLLWEHDDTRDLAVTARAIHDRLKAWVALNGLHVLLRPGLDEHGRPTLEVAPGAWPSDSRGDNYAQAEDGVELGIPGFGREAGR